MTAGVETVVAERWLFDRLGGDAGPGGIVTLAPGGVHANVAIGPVAFPYVVFRYISAGRPPASARGVRIWVPVRYDVVAVAAGRDQVAIEPLVARIEARLNLQSGTVEGGEVVVCENVGPINFSDQQGDRFYLNLGASYEIKVQVTA